MGSAGAVEILGEPCTGARTSVPSSSRHRRRARANLSAPQKDIDIAKNINFRRANTSDIDYEQFIVIDLLVRPRVIGLVLRKYQCMYLNANCVLR